MPSSGVIAAQLAQCESLQRLNSTYGYSPVFRLVRGAMEHEVWISPQDSGSRGDPAGQFRDDLRVVQARVDQTMDGVHEALQAAYNAQKAAEDAAAAAAARQHP